MKGVCELEGRACGSSGSGGAMLIIFGCLPAALPDVKCNGLGGVPSDEAGHATPPCCRHSNVHTPSPRHNVAMSFPSPHPPQATSTEECPVKMKLVAPPLYVLTTQTLDKVKGVEVLTIGAWRGKGKGALENANKEVGYRGRCACSPGSRTFFAVS